MVWIILAFFVGHWALSVFCQTFFLHRYGAHRMFSMSKGWERFFYLLTWVSQGSSFLNPRAYAILHREHHAYSDTARDPHSPHTHTNVFRMMWATKERYEGVLSGRIEAEERFEGGYPAWAWVDRVGDAWVTRVLFGVAYTAFYLAFAPHWIFFLLLPVHLLMGPVHGAIVNWGGHKYGYRNFAVADESVNSLPLDFLTAGELFQNNHHKFGMAPNFAVRWFEVDPAFQVMRILDALGIIDMKGAQQTHWSPGDQLPEHPEHGAAPALPHLNDAE